MSGHSKWSTIKRAKGAKDVKKAQTFTKLARPITVAAREGGGDPDMNAALRTAIDAARASNMPKDNIERAIKRGTGELEGAILETVRYEGYGPNGVAFLVDAITDNRNRTASEVKRIFASHGGTLATPGSVAWMFEQKGVIRVEKIDEEMQLKAIEAGAEDVRVEDNGLTIITAPANLEAIKKALQVTATFAGLDMIPKTIVALDAETDAKVKRLLEALEESDDVSIVYTNSSS